jgi:hypothetical protein
MSAIDLAIQTSGILAASHLPAFTGDVTKPSASAATTVTSVNGVNISALGTGLLKWSSGTPSLSVPGTDYAGLASANTFSSAQTSLVPNVVGLSSSAVLATGGTIAITSAAMVVAPASAVTGVIMTSGTKAGQAVVVINTSSFSITFAAVATSHVADGTSDIIVALTAREFIWGGTSWFRTS